LLSKASGGDFKQPKTQAEIKFKEADNLEKRFSSRFQSIIFYNVKQIVIF